MVRLKIKKELEEISSFLETLKSSIHELTNSQLKILQDCLENEINSAESQEELIAIVNVIYSNLNSIITQISSNSSSYIEPSNCDDCIDNADMDIDSDDLVDTPLNDDSSISDLSSNVPTLTRIFAVDPNGNHIYPDEYKDDAEIIIDDSNDEFPDSKYVVDLNKFEADGDNLNSLNNIDSIPENPINLNDIPQQENNTIDDINNNYDDINENLDNMDNIEDTTNDNSISQDNLDNVTQAVSSIEYSQNVISNQLDNIKDNLNISTPDITEPLALTDETNENNNTTDTTNVVDNSNDIINDTNNNANPLDEIANADVEEPLNI